MNVHREYWKQKLQPDMPRLELPVDHPREAAGGLTGGRAVSIIDEETTRGLTSLALRCGTSLFGAVLASICVLLYRYTGQQEIIAGFQSTGREHHQLEDQIGAYLNTVVLRAMLEPALSIAETVTSIGETLLEALDHSAYPFDLLLEELRPRTPVNRSPIFDVQLDYIPGLDSVNADSMNKGLAITDLSQDTARSKYDLSILILESSKGLEVITVYNANLFRRETIETMHRRLAIIQKAFLEDDGTRISDIQLFGEGSRAAGKRVRVGLRLGGVGQEVAAGDSIG
jgi:non-ribosomal peptide synthetase component F